LHLFDSNVVDNVVIWAPKLVLGGKHGINTSLPHGMGPPLNFFPPRQIVDYVLVDMDRSLFNMARPKFDIAD